MNTATQCPTRNDSDYADGIDLPERARVTALSVVERTSYPHRALMRDLMVIGNAIQRLHSTGHNETELRLISQFADALIDDLFHTITPDMEQIVARHESMADQREQAIQDLRLINGDSALLKEEHAKALEIDAASGRTYARVLRRLAARERKAQAVARSRFNLPEAS
jgi:hypothetical protein